MNRRKFTILAASAPVAAILVDGSALSPADAQTNADPLPSWNAGAAKTAILNFVRAATDSSGPNFLRPEDRVATFDQDGTLWVEHPVYAQVEFAFDRVFELAPQHPEWKTTEPFKSVLSRDKAAMAQFTTKDLEAIVAQTQTGMSTDAFATILANWLATAKDSRWHRPYTDLIYGPMLEVMRYLRANGFRTYIVTGGGQAFVRAYSQRVYGVAPDHVIGSALKTKFSHDKNGRAVLIREPALLLNNNMSGKAEDIYLFLGGRPHAAFGNSTGDREMLEFTQGNTTGPHLMMLVLHDDGAREYAYGPAQGLPNSTIGTFTQALYDEANAKGWNVISMKHDWNRVFPFDS
ncbi:MAG TPA: HAD family hydrolase [Verrucomicrobiae bacterium]|nr:HAD family hydrolase [Verrucomicrobiae bacterium]